MFFLKKAREFGQPHVHGYTEVGNKSVQSFAASVGEPTHGYITFYHYIPKAVISMI